MFIGCQFSLYPMTDRFIDVILGAVGGLRDRTDLRVETDDLSTLLVGAPGPLFDAVQQAFLKAAAGAEHVVLSATFSLGCPGEPDEPICHPRLAGSPAPTPGPSPAAVPPSGVTVAAQFALYPLGVSTYMDVIYREIEATKAADVAVHGKHFCTRLDGDAAHVFAALRNAFERAAGDAGHVVLTATVSYKDNKTSEVEKTSEVFETSEV